MIGNVLNGLSRNNKKESILMREEDEWKCNERK